VVGVADTKALLLLCVTGLNVDMFVQKNEDTERAIFLELRNVDMIDTSTYDENRRRRVSDESSIKETLPEFGTRLQTAYRFEELVENLSGVPSFALMSPRSGINGNQSFRVTDLMEKMDILFYRNKYYVFQPDTLSDIRLLFAFIVARFLL
jgi:hypothetical protein